MLIQNKQVGNKGLFYVGQDGAILAELVYNVPSPEKMVIEHTEVDESLKGKNVGYELVETAVNYARTHHMKIVPLCPFARALINRTKEWHDVLE
jgi:predicted GNAT family acetyltransferase